MPLVLRTHQTVKKQRPLDSNSHLSAASVTKTSLIECSPKSGDARRRTDQHIHTVHFRVAAVKAALRKLVPSKATGQDGIPARVLKECASELALPLCKLFTLSFVTSACPAAWKIAMVVPVHKNIRSQELPPRKAKGPLSTPIRLPTWAGNIGSPHQAAFRMEKSERSWWLCLHDCCRHSRSIRQSVTRWRPSLSSLLRSHRRSPDVAEELLAGPPAQSCGQRPGVPLYPVQAGVPQSSILGPPLFLLYVNSCEDVVPDGVKLAVYADNTTLYQVLKTEATIIQSRSLLQAAVDAVFAWGAAWKIRFEPSKSQALIIDHHRPAWTVPTICFGGTPVDEESEIKLLGVTFDTHLTFNSHIRSVALRANSHPPPPSRGSNTQPQTPRDHVQGIRSPAPGVCSPRLDGLIDDLTCPTRQGAATCSAYNQRTHLGPKPRFKSLLSHTCTSSTASTCPHRSAALFHRQRPRSPVPTPRNPAASLPAPTNFSCRAIFLSLLAPACIVLFLSGSSPPGFLSHRLS